MLGASPSDQQVGTMKNDLVAAYLKERFGQQLHDGKGVHRLCGCQHKAEPRNITGQQEGTCV